MMNLWIKPQQKIIPIIRSRIFQTAIQFPPLQDKLIGER